MILGPREYDPLVLAREVLLDDSVHLRISHQVFGAVAGDPQRILGKLRVY